jgi:hypothetical protein
LIAFAAVDPAVERGQLGRKRRHLADGAAGVVVAQAQVAARIFHDKRARRRDKRPHVGQAQLCDQPVAIGERLLE